MPEFSIITAKNSEELETFTSMMNYAFAASPPRSAIDEKPPAETDYFSRSSRYLLYTDNVPTSSLHAIPMTQSVRGKIFPMLGIAGVSTFPEHRRKGYVKKLMSHSLKEGKKSDQVFTTLYPFRESFYGAFGYITFPQSRELRFSPSQLKDVQSYRIQGNIERYYLGNQLDRYYQFLQELQLDRHGWSLFQRDTTQRLEKAKKWIIFGTINGEDKGMMLVDTTGFEKAMNINLFVYKDSSGKYLMLDHLARHVDQFSSLEMRILADEQPETWLFDTKPKIKNRDWVPSPMGRILDIAQIGGMEVGDGDINIKITDPNCAWNTGNWHLYSENGRLTITKSELFDVEMTISGISALVYGGYNFDDMVLRGWINSPDSKNELLNLFPDMKTELLSLF